jgi:hypothetical protein
MQWGLQSSGQLQLWGAVDALGGLTVESYSSQQLLPLSKILRESQGNREPFMET